MKDKRTGHSYPKAVWTTLTYQSRIHYLCLSLSLFPLALVEFKEGFGLFDRKGNGTIEAGSLGDLLRALGQNPTQSEVRELIAQADPTGSNVINFEKFLEVLMRPDGFKPAGTYQEFINGFKVFDKEGNGYISVGELRYGAFFLLFLVRIKCFFVC